MSQASGLGLLGAPGPTSSQALVLPKPSYPGPLLPLLLAWGTGAPLRVRLWEGAFWALFQVMEPPWGPSAGDGRCQGPSAPQPAA